MKYLYYYKRSSGAWHFYCPESNTATLLTNDRDAINYLIKMRKAKYTSWRFYLDLPEDFEKIKSMFFTPEYWENKTWQEEDAL